MELPTISVVTPSFEQAGFLERAMRSVLDQGYPKLEYIVLDGGSTDGSSEIIGRHAGQLAYWRSAPDSGQAAAVNEGWRRASGDILGWLNSDDYYLDGALRIVGEFFRDHPDVDWAYGINEYVDPAGEVLRANDGGPFDAARFTVARQHVPQPATFVRRSLYERAGELDESLYLALDFEYFLRLNRLARPAFIPQRLSASTVHPEAKTTRLRVRTRLEMFDAAARYASRRGRLTLLLMRIRLLAYHGLPNVVRGRLDRLRGLPVLRAR